MSDHFETEAAAEDFCSGLQRRYIRALVLDPTDDSGTWRVISPDLDFRREERVWKSAAEALAERIGAEIPEKPLPAAETTDPVAPVPQTEGEAILNRHQDKAVKESAIYKAMTEGECPQCGGDGKGPLTHHFGEPCPTCSGTGKGKA